MAHVRWSRCGTGSSIIPKEPVRAPNSFVARSAFEPPGCILHTHLRPKQHSKVGNEGVPKTICMAEIASNVGRGVLRKPVAF